MENHSTVLDSLGDPKDSMSEMPFRWPMSEVYSRSQAQARFVALESQMSLLVFTLYSGQTGNVALRVSRAASLGVVPTDRITGPVVTSCLLSEVVVVMTRQDQADKDNESMLENQPSNNDLKEWPIHEEGS